MGFPFLTCEVAIIWSNIMIIKSSNNSSGNAMVDMVDFTPNSNVSRLSPGGTNQQSWIHRWYHHRPMIWQEHEPPVVVMVVVVLSVVSTHLKNISQIESFPQVGLKIKNIWNHHPVVFFPGFFTIVGGDEQIPISYHRTPQMHGWFWKTAGTGATFHYEHPGSVCFRFMPTCLKILTGVSLVIDVQNEIRKAFCLIILAFNLAKSSCIELVIHLLILLDWWKIKVLGEIMSILAQE